MAVVQLPAEQSGAKAPFIAALAPILAERYALLGSQHHTALFARLMEASRQPELFSANHIEKYVEPTASLATASTEIVAVIPIIGILTKYPMPEDWMDEWCGLCPTMRRMEYLDNAVADPQIKTIVLDIDSPGGFVNGSVEFADAVAAANKIKPVIAIIRGICCSGAYWIAAQCRQIIARRENEIGNIGCYSVLWDYTKLFAACGYEPTLVTSGQFKGMGADGKVTDDLKNDTQRIINGIGQQFITAVANGRGMDLERVTELSDGRAYLGPTAKSLGLIDDVASSFEAAIETAIGAASAPETGASMATANATAGAGKPTRQTDAGKGDGTDVAGVLNATIASANSHRDQARKALDACGAYAGPPDDETKTLIGSTIAVLQSASDESQRCAEAWQKHTDSDDEEEDDKGDEMAKKVRKANFTSGDYINAFGDAGARWFLEGKPFATATAEHIGAIKAGHKAEVDTLKTENAALKIKLEAMPRGNDEASFTVADAESAPASKKFNNLKPGLRAFAESIRLPGQK